MCGALGLAARSAKAWTQSIKICNLYSIYRTVRIWCWGSLTLFNDSWTFGGVAPVMIESVRLLLGQQTFHWWLLPFTHGWKEEQHRCISLAAARGRSFVYLCATTSLKLWLLFCNVYGNIPQYLLNSSVAFKTHLQTIDFSKMYGHGSE